MERFRASVLVSLLAAGIALFGAGGQLVVVVHPDSGITHLSREEVARIFMGSQKRFASGLVALPVEPVAPEAIRERFYQLLVNLPLPQVRSYWAQMYFSGQAQPPRQVKDEEEVVEIVSANKGAVGFLEEDKPIRKVRVVLVLGDPVRP
jgi:hypothetical protein